MIDSGFLVSLISCNTFLALVFVNCASTNITPSAPSIDRKSTRLNSSHGYISYAVFCLKKKKKTNDHVAYLNSVHAGNGVIARTIATLPHTLPRGVVSYHEGHGSDTLLRFTRSDEQVPP